MGYPELVRALEEEAERQVGEVRDEGARAADRLLAEAMALVARERDEALAKERKREEEEVGRRAAETQGARDRALLLEMRRLLDEAFQQAEARLPAPGDAELIARLVDELLPEVDADGDILVEPADVAEVQRRLASAGSTLRVVASPVGGGARVALAGRRILDNTLRARLARARAGLEPEVARLLFGDDHARS